MSVPHAFTSLRELEALVQLINSSFHEIKHACITQGKDFPFLNEPSTLESEAIVVSPEVVKAGSVITAAAYQLVAAVRPPTLTLFAQANTYFISSSLGVVIQAHVPEILREAGPKGLDIKGIAAPTGINADKLGHVLRLLATNHIFREVAPDVFANNRLSASLDTGKSVADILADPESKYDGTASAAAMIETMTTDGLLNAAHFSDVLFNPNLTNSGEPNETAFNLAFKTDLPYFEWLSKPEQAYKNKRFITGMHAGNRISAQGVILKGESTRFDWKSLPEDSVVVDVAGGVGTQTLTLAKEFSHLKYVVQDRASVIEDDAHKFWNAELPEVLSSGRVQLQAHDIFAPQPIRGAAVFIVRAIVHDWSDDYCVKFLSQLRAAATPSTQLIVIDNVIPYACADSQPSLDSDVPGAANVRPTAPAPLLPNFGAASLLTYLADIAMLSQLNGQERTIAQFARLFERSGWKLVRVHTDGFNYHDIKTIGVPA
ncbi:S-adenosyl-L-methionine-dependent methyltransferase [Irpex rosettiformis]|uniref:S-adenosyl-L-methionine-dependent methyltransferase n=1 Tax=Irpex rosettiformis TaxID=378272 RepID=A0ACB8TYI6_9APHY|nr:S-adenosyl-L-methionine-dependent methyltransferase [Irpex rosettiformis]